MADLKDILGLGSKSESRSSRGSNATQKKRSNLPRELQGLKGDWDEATTQVPTVRPVFKAKRTKAVSWKCLLIKSSARHRPGRPQDKLEIKHWVKVHDAPDYRFARLNKMIKMAMYTNEEYNKFLQDPMWSRDQTDRLFQLCSTFDLRFILIHDHFTNPAVTDIVGQDFLDEEEKEVAAGDHGDLVLSVHKSVEDLKERFYKVQKSLLTARNSSDPDLLRHPMFQQQFDLSYETERKHQLNRLLSRSKEQVSQMAQNVLENRTLTQMAKALKRKDKGKGDKGGRGKGEMAPIPDNCIAKTTTRRKPAGVILRSMELANALGMSGRQTSKQLETEMASLGLKKSKPVAVPTQKVAKAMHKLQCDVLTYINLSKHVLKVETERDQLKAQHRARSKRSKTNKRGHAHDDKKSFKRQKTSSGR